MKRGKFTSKFKTNVVLAALKEHQSLSELAQKYELAPTTQISKWEKEFLLGAESVFSSRQISAKTEVEMERDRTSVFTKGHEVLEQIATKISKLLNVVIG